MQFRRPLSALALAALTATAAQAENFNQNITLIPNAGSPTSLSASFGVTHRFAGAFTDTFTFLGGGAQGFVSAALATIGFTPGFNINFTSVTLNGVPLTQTATGAFETAQTMMPIAANAPFVLTVNGIAGSGLDLNSPIAASYAGTVNLSPIPEPHPAALWLAGLAAVGTLMRRRIVR